MDGEQPVAAVSEGISWMLGRFAHSESELRAGIDAAREASGIGEAADK